MHNKQVKFKQKYRDIFQRLQTHRIAHSKLIWHRRGIEHKSQTGNTQSQSTVKSILRSNEICLAKDSRLRGSY